MQPRIILVEFVCLTAACPRLALSVSIIDLCDFFLKLASCLHSKSYITGIGRFVVLDTPYLQLCLAAHI